jgi:hypothetical protein
MDEANSSEKIGRLFRGFEYRKLEGFNFSIQKNNL